MYLLQIEDHPSRHGTAAYADAVAEESGLGFCRRHEGEFFFRIPDGHVPGLKKIKILPLVTFKGEFHLLGPPFSVIYQ